MIPGRSKGIFCDHPSWWKDSKIAHSNSGFVGRTSENRENRGIRMIEADAIHSIKMIQIIFVGSVVSMPGHNVIGRMRESGLVKFATELINNLIGIFIIFIESGGGFKVPWISQTIGSNRT